MTNRTEWVSTDRLATGDVVWSHGMRLLLTCEQRWSWAPDTYRFVGLILNAETVDPDTLAWANRFYPRDTWHVQGNTVALWAREIDES